MPYEAVIGLEVHVQLLTASKMFCRCPNRFGAEPNSLVCPVCLGYPGTLPLVNRQAVDLAVKLALALGCEIEDRSVFARKNYFYPDLPKGYQISQYDRPLAVRGEVPLTQHAKRVGIHRLHLEEDAGKLLHEAPGGGALPGTSLVDFNRCGVPLVEIVSEPDMATSSEAQDYLQALRRVLLYTETSDANLEEGSMRCDANVSVRPVGKKALGTKTEVKNLNSFRNVARALDYEIARQVELLEAGGRVVQETMTYDAAAGVTRSLRSKEEAHDYRYFPEPDLPFLVLSRDRIEAAAAELPELPWERRCRLVEEYGLPADDAEVLTDTRELADYFEAAAASTTQVKAVGNWVRTEVLRELKERKLGVSSALPPPRLGALIEMIAAGELSNTAAKTVFVSIWESGEEPAAAVSRLGLGQVRDAGRVEEWVEEVIEEFPAQVEQFRSGKAQVLGFLVGQVMKRSGGRAEPRLIQETLRSALEREAERQPGLA